MKIEFDDVSYSYQPPKGPPVLALNSVTFSVEPSEFVAIVGPSGCGKSTLLYLLGGFLTLSKGQIRVDGRPVTSPGPDRGIVFQHFALFPWKTVKQNILYGLENQGVAVEQRNLLAEKFIDLVKLSGFGDVYPSQLSGGMKQRVAIARTLVTNPGVLLMDEPFGALDAQTRALLQEELLVLWTASPKAVLFVTHDVHEAVLLADRILVMSARPGQIRAVVNVDLPRPRSREVIRSTAFADRCEYVDQLVRGQSGGVLSK